MRSEATWKWTAAGLLLIIGLIHLVEAPDQFGDAPYKGVLFLIAAAGAALAAAGIWRGNQLGWRLGVLIAAGAFAGYFWSRTVGLPGLPVDPNMFEPIGLMSVVADVLFLAVAARREMRGRRGIAGLATARQRS